MSDQLVWDGFILMLPNKSRNLAIHFKCSTTKGHFPHKFITKDNLNYRGVMTLKLKESTF